MKRSLALLAVVVVAALGASACSGDASGYAYVFDGQTTTAATVDRELQALKDNDLFNQAVQQSGSAVSSTNGSINAQLSAAWVNALVQYEAIDQELDERGVEVTDADRTQAQTQAATLFGSEQVFSRFPEWFRKRELAREARKVAYVRKFSKAPTDAEAQAYFAANQAQICPSGKVISHILVATQAEAEAVKAQLDGGADFAALAKTQSLDTTSGAQGGLVGCITAGQTVQQFQDAADALPIGQISDPVQTQYGFHIISAQAPTYALFATQIRQALEQQASGEVTGRIGRRLKRVTLKVNPRYGRIRRSTGGLEVVAPRQPSVRSQPPTTTTTRPTAPGGTGATPTPTAPSGSDSGTSSTTAPGTTSPTP